MSGGGRNSDVGDTGSCFTMGSRVVSVTLLPILLVFGVSRMLCLYPVS